MPQGTGIPHAGVHVPPPFIYMGALAVGWFLNRLRALPLTPENAVAREIGGALLIVAALVLLLAAFLTFRRARTTVLPNRPASALTQGGPYRFTRNPMYVAMTLLYLGLTLEMNSAWTLLLLPVVLGIIDRFVIAREERYLMDAFPEYAAYARRVRRWF